MHDSAMVIVKFFNESNGMFEKHSTSLVYTQCQLLIRGFSRSSILKFTRVIILYCCNASQNNILLVFSMQTPRPLK